VSIFEGVLLEGSADVMAAWEVWVRATTLSHFIRDHGDLWPVLETLHYFGLSLLLGAIGLFDLRVLGVAKAIPPAMMHGLVPLGVLGFSINLVTGICFFSAFPEQYAYNRAFHAKLIFMAAAGLNVLLFYSAVFRSVQRLEAGEDAPFPAKLLTGISLFAWIAVLICGRLLTFFRPPFFH
jgi:hypothetical protein